MSSSLMRTESITTHYQLAVNIQHAKFCSALITRLDTTLATSSCVWVSSMKPAIFWKPSDPLVTTTPLSTSIVHCTPPTWVQRTHTRMSQQSKSLIKMCSLSTIIESCCSSSLAMAQSSVLLAWCSRKLEKILEKHALRMAGGLCERGSWMREVRQQRAI